VAPSAENQKRPAASLLEVKPSGVIVASLKPGADKKCWIAKLYNASGRPENINLRGPICREGSIYMSNPSEDRLERVRGPLSILPFGIVTVRVEKKILEVQPQAETPGGLGEKGKLRDQGQAPAEMPVEAEHHAEQALSLDFDFLVKDKRLERAGDFAEFEAEIAGELENPQPEIQTALVSGQAEFLKIFILGGLETGHLKIQADAAPDIDGVTVFLGNIDFADHQALQPAAEIDVPAGLNIRIGKIRRAEKTIEIDIIRRPETDGRFVEIPADFLSGSGQAEISREVFVGKLEGKRGNVRRRPHILAERSQGSDQHKNRQEGIFFHGHLPIRNKRSVTSH
jgi:hypothetical protein